MTLRSIIPLLAIAAASALAGCGGGGSEESPQPVATSSLSKAQWIRRATAICTENLESRLQQYATYTAQHSGESQEKIFGSVIQDVVVPGLEKRDAELRALGAPAGDEAQVEEILAALDRIAEVARGLEGGPPTHAYEEAPDRALAVARKYGLTECNG